MSTYQGFVCHQAVGNFFSLPHSRAVTVDQRERSDGSARTAMDSCAAAARIGPSEIKLCCFGSLVSVAVGHESLSFINNKKKSSHR